MRKEKWVTIPDTKNFYQVSDLGNVRSVERLVEYKDDRKPRLWPSKLLNGYVGTNGYKQVDLKIEGNVRKEILHRIVCVAFKKNPENHKYVNHKDSDKLNNKASNLEWCNNSENVLHSFASGRHSGKGATHYRARVVTDGVNIFGCSQEAADFYKISRKTVFDMVRGRVTNRLNLSYL